jgi:hypothetical protein
MNKKNPFFNFKSICPEVLGNLGIRKKKLYGGAVDLVNIL